MTDWDGNASLLDHLGAMGSMRLEGVGVLTSPPAEGHAPERSGKVNFAVEHRIGDMDRPYGESIAVTLTGLDDDANAILRHRSSVPGVPLPFYSLEGTLTWPSHGTPMRLESVFLDPTSLTINRSKEEMDTLFDQVEALERFMSSEGAGNDEDFDLQRWSTSFKEWMEAPGWAVECGAWTWKVVVGDDTEASEPSGCRLLIPNLITQATASSGELRFEVQPAPGAEARLEEPESRGKVLPGCFVDVLLTRNGFEGEVALAAVELGWLLSFWSGRAVHPIAREFETSRGPVWYVETKTVTPYKRSNPNTCLLTLELEDLSAFLQNAWVVWRDLSNADDDWIRTLKSVISTYQETLCATFANVALALTAMSLERLRDRALGESELLRDLRTSRRGKVEREVRKAIEKSIEGTSRLSDAEDVRQRLLDSLAANPGKVKEVFRKPFQEALEDLLRLGGHYAERTRLNEYVRRRNEVVHGTASGGAETALEAHRLAQYGLAQIEKLVLRRLEYIGLYFDRVAMEVKEFPEGRASW